MNNIVIASDNRGKLNEFIALLRPSGYQAESQAAFGVRTPPEDGATFVDNALIKARHAARATGLACIADDSGLSVDALGGAPGVHSARYAGEDASDADNRAKLLQAMRGLSGESRRAHFSCALVFLRDADDDAPLICEGVWSGVILDAARGENGFGYDCIFAPDGLTRSAAELSAAEKNQLSHRAQALSQLKHKLASRGLHRAR